MRASRLLALAAFCLAPLASWAVPTGLNVMPTADVLGIAGSRIEYESSGNGKLFNPTGGSIYGTQTGLVLGFEIGADAISNDKTRYNVKWRFKNEGLVLPALAVGAQNIVSGERTQYYAVATKSLLPSKLLKVSAGVLTDVGDTVLMYGAQAQFGMVVLKADAISGGGDDRSAVSAGISNRGLGIAGTLYHFDGGDDERTVTLTYGTTF